MKLRFTKKAASELHQVLEYIDGRSTQGASSVKARINAMLHLLLQHPNAGQLTNKAGLRRVVAYAYPYLIFESANDR